jgi:glycosyltransferase involved in cell wall biosynthesis
MNSRPDYCYYQYSRSEIIILATNQRQNTSRRTEMSRQDLPFVTAITPTFNRAYFLRKSLRDFQNDSYPTGLKEWIIIDSTPKEYSENEAHRQKFLNDIKDLPWVRYYSLPSRSAVPEAYDKENPLAFSHLHREQAEYLKLTNELREQSKSDPRSEIQQQFRDAADPKLGRPSIGEKRNIACELARGKYIVHRDDDDYYGPNYMKDTVNHLQSGFDFMRWGDFYVYMVGMNIFGSYKFDAPHGCYRVSKEGSPTFIDKETLQQQKASGSIRQEGHGYGLLFSYSKDIWRRAGGFAPLFTEEDVHMVKRIEEIGGRIDFPKGLTDRACRVVHGNSTSSRIYQIYNPDEVPGALWQMASSYHSAPSSLDTQTAEMRSHLIEEAQRAENSHNTHEFSPVRSGDTTTKLLLPLPRPNY